MKVVLLVHHRRRSGVCRVDPVRRVKQAPEPTVHARHAKPVSIVRRQRLMLLHVSIAHKVFLKPHKARVIVCRAFRKLVAVVFVDWWWCLLIGGDGQWLF